MFDKHQFACVFSGCSKVHGSIFSVKCETRQSNSMSSLIGTHLDSRFIFYDFIGFCVSLFRIPELDTSYLSCRLYGNERVVFIGNAEYRTYGMIF